jgi:DNA-binding NtrC family response regulator
MQIQPPTPPESKIPASPVLVLNKDLFFGVTIANALRALGYAPISARSTKALESAISLEPEASLVIIDIAAVDDWDALKTTIDAAPDIPSIAFGSHTNVDGLRSAKRIGLTRVFSNGEFHRTMGPTISRYARPLE